MSVLRRASKYWASFLPPVRLHPLLRTSRLQRSLLPLSSCLGPTTPPTLPESRLSGPWMEPPSLRSTPWLAMRAHIPTTDCLLLRCISTKCELPTRSATPPVPTLPASKRNPHRQCCKSETSAMGKSFSHGPVRRTILTTPLTVPPMAQPSPQSYYEECHYDHFR